ncbi:hypothetical protein UCRPA7_1414 [Phaeoacremonium minimum UCRPA7]|uniref:Uncharacterized protein n=1 Tax=Phaeoacremonium minimum (strain UCR-PA7) TaxID=1286976 RepID=R8BUV5_PHAM7|nr:hypothetical protein UCRPA7_1414 [Phaeoacremonium minimum UCRPA7]EOO03074.1 hypothetical protein UCRPA7_1414 [Phaeoacremonium minimum UCRPA7]
MAQKPPLSNGILDSRGRQTPLALQSQARYSYRIDKARRVFVTVGVLSPNDGEDQTDESTDEDEEEDDDKDEGESEEPEEIDKDSRCSVEEQGDGNRDQLRKLEDQFGQLDIGDAKVWEPPMWQNTLILCRHVGSFFG